jgi:hypothetical protein
MIKVLYVNGCSHSAGAEMSKPGFYRQPYDLENSFGGVLARRHGLAYQNDACPGGSNNLIQTTTVQSILKLLETYDPSEIFVVIGWTGYDRSELVYNNKLYKFIPNSTILDCPTNITEWYRAWVMCTNNDSSMNNFLLQYGLIATFLKQHGIKYYFFNSIIPAYIPKNNYLHEVLDNKPNTHLINMMENDPYFLEPFNGEMTFFHILKQTYDGTKDGRWYHFTEDAHIAWANFLTERIEKLYPNLWT